MNVKKIVLGSLVFFGSLQLSDVARGTGVSVSDKLPQELKSFKGTLYGRVLSKDGKGNSFVLKLSSHPGNPRGEMGMQFRIRVGHTKEADGKYHPIKSQLAYIKKLDIGQDIHVIVQSDEEDSLNVVDFPEDKSSKN